MIAARVAETGIVKIHAHNKLTVTPHLTADTLFSKPTPTIDPVMVCVVDTGIPKCSVNPRVTAPAVSAATPSKAFTFVIFEPIVLTIFHPPLMVPKDIAA